MKRIKSPPKPDIHRLLELQRFLIQFQNIERSIHVPPRFRLENDTEHCYNLALTAWYLSAFFPELDKDTLIRTALAHDMIEVHAGDTFAFADKNSIDQKPLREAAAMKLLETEWADFPDLLAALRSYHEKDTPEAKFIYALDKIMPIMLVFLGEGYSWHKFGVTHEQQHEVKRLKVAVSPEINDFYEQLYQLLSAHGHYFPKPSHQG